MKLLLVKFGVLALILILWQWLGGTVIPLYIISRPSDIALSLVKMTASGALWRHTSTTLLESLWAYLIGVTIGLLLAFGLFRNKSLADVLEPFVHAVNGIPRVAIAPLFIIWLGIGPASKTGIGASMAFFLVFVTTYTGLKNLDMGLIRYARLLGASEPMILREIMLPGIAPYLISGLKMTVSQTIIGVVVGEYIASFRGLGWLIQRSAALFDSASLFAGILVLLVIVVALTGLITLVEKRLVRWESANVTEN